MALQFLRAMVIARDMLSTLYHAANEICKGARIALPLAKRQYPNNTALHDALQAVTDVCETLALAIQDQKMADIDGQNHEVPPSPAQPTPEPETPEPEPDPDPPEE